MGLISFGLLGAVITLALYGMFNPEKVARGAQKGDILVNLIRRKNGKEATRVVRKRLF
jgi:hypothetical protein